MIANGVGGHDAQVTNAAAPFLLRPISSAFPLFEEPQRLVEIQANFCGSRCFIVFSKRLFVNYFRYIF